MYVYGPSWTPSSSQKNSEDGADSDSGIVNGGRQVVARRKNYGTSEAPPLIANHLTSQSRRNFAVSV